jgi:hypothetical protein
MANTTRWVIDSAYTAATFTGGDLISLATGGGALSTSVVANATNLDQYADVSFVVTVGGTTGAGSYITIFLLPLNQDATTYGDGYASSATTQPAAGYAVGSIGVKTGVTSGGTVTGTIPFVSLPPRGFKLAFGNNLGVALSASPALTLSLSAYNTNLNV